MSTKTRINGYDGVDVFARAKGFYVEHFRCAPSDVVSVVLKKIGPFDTRLETEQALRAYRMKAEQS